MKTGFHTGAFGTDPLSKTIPGLAALGYQGIELNAENSLGQLDPTPPFATPNVTPQLSPKERAEIRRLAEDHGVEVSSLSAHIWLLCDADRQDRQSHVNYVKGCIDLAPDLGTNVVHVMSGMHPPGATKEEAWGWMVESIGACARYAAEQGVIFAIEPDGPMLLDNYEDLNRLFDDLKGEKLYVNFDPSWVPLGGDDPIYWVRTFGSRIVHTHMKDGRALKPGTGKVSIPGVSDRFAADFEFCPLGKGMVKFGEMVSALREVGYDGFLSVEWEGFPFGYEEDPWEVASREKRFLDNLLSH